VAPREGVWRIDVAICRDPLTGLRRRVSKSLDALGARLEIFAVFDEEGRRVPIH
jgi:hypothetical protein